MIIERMDEWLENLNGQHEQATGVLVASGTGSNLLGAKCCLGVYCAIHPDVEITDEPDRDASGLVIAWRDTGRKFRNLYYLPERLQRELDLHKLVRKDEKAKLEAYCLEHRTRVERDLSWIVEPGRKTKRMQALADMNDAGVSHPLIRDLVIEMGWNIPTGKEAA